MVVVAFIVYRLVAATIDSATSDETADPVPEVEAVGVASCGGLLSTFAATSADDAVVITWETSRPLVAAQRHLAALNPGREPRVDVIDGVVDGYVLDPVDNTRYELDVVESGAGFVTVAVPLTSLSEAVADLRFTGLAVDGSDTGTCPESGTLAVE